MDVGRSSVWLYLLVFLDDRHHLYFHAYCAHFVLVNSVTYSSYVIWRKGEGGIGNDGGYGCGKSYSGGDGSGGGGNGRGGGGFETLDGVGILINFFLNKVNFLNTLSLNVLIQHTLGCISTTRAGNVFELC